MAVIPEKLVRIRIYESETNNSNISEKNMTRTYNEYVDIRKHFFDETFRSAKNTLYRCVQSNEPVWKHLAC